MNIRNLLAKFTMRHSRSWCNGHTAGQRYAIARIQAEMKGCTGMSVSAWCKYMWEFVNNYKKEVDNECQNQRR